MTFNLNILDFVYFLEIIYIYTTIKQQRLTVVNIFFKFIYITSIFDYEYFLKIRYTTVPVLYKILEKNLRDLI